MRFSWKALLLSPLPGPVLASGLLALGPNNSPLLAFLFILVPSAVIAYGATICLLLPTLFLLSRFTPLTTWLTGLAGAGLGVMAYFPIAWMMWKSSGADSGPPSDLFVEYLFRRFWGESWPFLLGGLVTAMAYWFLTRPPAKLAA